MAGFVSASAAELRLRATDAAGEAVWARWEVRGALGKMYQPSNALLDRTARNRPGGQPWYLGSFVARGRAQVELPAGVYTVVCERGTEFERFEEQIEVSHNQPLELTVQLQPWIRMNELGWWSADFHIHRPPEDVPSLALAEGLDLSVVFTMWNKRNLWNGKEWPSHPEVQVSPKKWMTLLNAEDERGGGAWMLHGLRAKLDLAVDGRWFPAGIRFIREARRQRPAGEVFPWVDVEKPFWWEVPVVMALEPPDSFGVLHNHFNQYGIHDSEAWGRPRDRELYGGWDGFAGSSFDLYYRYLNLGFRVPPSAGSASGVLPNPAGYNRTYVKPREPFSVQAWYEGLRGGESFVTNGPMLFVDAEPLPGGSVRLRMRAVARAPLDRLEVIANGTRLHTFLIPAGETSFEKVFEADVSRYSWLAVRCFEKSETTIRMAHSRPIFLPENRYDASRDALFFVRWLDELIEISRTEENRFSSEAERDTVLELYQQARAFYSLRIESR